jgi:hypothetical protein
MFQATFSARVSKVAEILGGVSQEAVLKVLSKEGLKDDQTSLAVLDSPTTTIEDIVGIIKAVDNVVDNPGENVISNLKLKTAASFLKGEGFERPKQVPPVPVSSQTPLPVNLVDAMKTRPIQQWNDRELLEKYDQERDPEIEQELHKRSQGRCFIVLKGKGQDGKDPIDIENSIEILKRARKMVTPSFLPMGSDGAVSPIYPILSLNLQDRIIDICPICGESLFKGYCTKCQISFGGVGGIGNVGIGDDERAYMKLVSDSENFNKDAYADRKALYASAVKGLEDLKKTWPSLIQKFEELKMTNSLPKLRVIVSRPSTVKDPFFQDGNRSFGQKIY